MGRIARFAILIGVAWLCGPASAVEIDGRHYWDGGLVSNTPLSQVFDSEPRRDSIIFQVDLWNARGELQASDELRQAGSLRYTHRAEDLANCTVYIVTVPTPVDDYKRPDVGPLISAMSCSMMAACSCGVLRE